MRALPGPMVVLGLLLGSFSVPHAAAAPGYEPVHDGAGDPTPFGLPLAPPVGVPTPVTGPYDLTEFGIVDEDEVGLAFYVKVSSLTGAPTTPISDNAAIYTVDGKIDGTKWTFELRWFLNSASQAGSGPRATNAGFALCRGGADGGGGGGGGPGQMRGDCYDQTVRGQVDFSANTLRAAVTKDAFMGRAPAHGVGTPADPPAITKGSRLADLVVTSSGGFPSFWSDRLPDQGSAPPYTFTTDAANGRIRLGLDTGLDGMAKANQTPPPPSQGPGPQPVPGQGGDGGAPTETSVVPGTPTLIRLRLDNNNPAKRIVNLTAAIDSPENAGKWSAQILPAVRVPAADSRVVNLIVNATPAVQHRERVDVVVHGRSLGVPDELAAIRIPLIATVPPTPEKPTLYFHAKTSQADTFSGTPVCDLFGCGGQETWMNTLEADPTADLDAGVPLDFQTFGGGASSLSISRGADFRLDTPLPSGLRLDAKKPIVATLAFSTPADFPGSVDVAAYASGTNRVLGEGTVSATVSNGAPVEVTFQPLGDQTTLTLEDGRLELRITVHATATGPGAVGASPELKVVPKASHVVFPFEKDPNAQSVRLTAGPALVSLSAQSDVEEFLNPGKGKIFNATVVNEGVQPDDARIEILFDNPNWRVDVYPGARFHLLPGDGAHFSLLVTAPAGAKEGDQLHILVNATSLNEPTALSQLHFTAIVTKGVDIPDESHWLHADADSAGKVVTPKAKNTPGFEVVLLMGALLAVALRRRA